MKSKIKKLTLNIRPFDIDLTGTLPPGAAIVGFGFVKVELDAEADMKFVSFSKRATTTT